MKEDNYIGFKLSCEPKVEPKENGFTTLVDNIICLRVKNTNELIVKELQKIMKEKGISELYAIDEIKVLQLVKIKQAFEIIKTKDLDLTDLLSSLKQKDYEYSDYLIGYDNDFDFLTEEEFYLLKEVFL